MQKVFFRVTLAGLLTITLLSQVSLPVQAQGVSASDLIAAVNALRASYDLVPYQVDGYWMNVAQEHSDYMASIGVLTHTRADGTEPGDHNITSENIGGGYAVTAQFLIDQWSDYWHTITLIGFSSGLVGAGVAEGDDGYLYYTLVVKNNGEMTGLPDSQSTRNPSAAEQTPLGTVETREPLMTSTPQEDGSISHQVRVGETLWDIAISYDVNVSDLASLNYLDPEDPVIYPGEILLVRPGYTPTATSTITNTPLPPTRTLRPSRTPQPTQLTATPAPASQETEVPLLPEDPLINRENINMLGTVTIVVAVMGAGALIFGRIWTKRNR
jgi:LysM repeat protein